MNKSYGISLKQVGRNQWKTLEPIDFNYNGSDYRVYTGFFTDLASVPRFLWWLFPPYGKYTRAAIIHDYMLCIGAVSRKEADHCFRQQLEISKVSYLTKQSMYIAVRLTTIVKGWFNK
jgi:hypothetical protein